VGKDIREAGWVEKILYVKEDILSTSPPVGIPIYPPSPLPLGKEGGIFTKGILLVGTLCKVGQYRG
jgi:hypothetical protein